jgi:hypothetical protein
VYTSAVTSEELEVEAQVKQRLGKNSVIVPLWSASIKHIDDIPFEWGGIKRISNTWFQKQTADVRTRPCFRKPLS